MSQTPQAEYDALNEKIKNQISRLDLLLRPVLFLLGIPQIDDRYLPESVRHERKVKQQVGIPNNRVDVILQRVAKLERELANLRRDFALDEQHCTWVESDKKGFVDDLESQRQTSKSFGLKVILSQHKPPPNVKLIATPAKEDTKNKASAAKTGSRRPGEDPLLSVPLKRAELYETAFIKTLEKVLDEMRELKSFKRKLLQEIATQEQQKSASRNARSRLPDFDSDSQFANTDKLERWYYKQYRTIPTEDRDGRLSGISFDKVTVSSSKQGQEHEDVITQWQREFDELEQELLTD